MNEPTLSRLIARMADPTALRCRRNLKEVKNGSTAYCILGLLGDIAVEDGVCQWMGPGNQDLARRDNPRYSCHDILPWEAMEHFGLSQTKMFALHELSDSIPVEDCPGFLPFIPSVRALLSTQGRRAE